MIIVATGRGPERAALPRSCQRPERKTLQRSPRRETHPKPAHRRGRRTPCYVEGRLMQHRGRAALQRRVKRPKRKRALAPVDAFVGTHKKTTTAAKADPTARDLRGLRRAALPRSCQRPERKTLQRSLRRETHHKLAHRRGRRTPRSTVEERRCAASSARKENGLQPPWTGSLVPHNEDDHRG